LKHFSSLYLFYLDGTTKTKPSDEDDELALFDHAFPQNHLKQRKQLRQHHQIPFNNLPHAIHLPQMIQIQQFPPIVLEQKLLLMVVVLLINRKLIQI
jgi:hypothetical protein